VYPFSASNLYW